MLTCEKICQLYPSYVKFFSEFNFSEIFQIFFGHPRRTSRWKHRQGKKTKWLSELCIVLTSEKICQLYPSCLEVSSEFNFWEILSKFRSPIFFGLLRYFARNRSVSAIRRTIRIPEISQNAVHELFAYVKSPLCWLSRNFAVCTFKKTIGFVGGNTPPRNSQQTFYHTI